MTNRGAEGGENGRGHGASDTREPIAVRTFDFRDQPVGAQESELTADPCGSAAGFPARPRCAREQKLLQVAIAEAGQVELGTCDGRQKQAVVVERA